MPYGSATYGPNKKKKVMKKKKKVSKSKKK